MSDTSRLRERAPRNRTLTLSPEELELYRARLARPRPDAPLALSAIEGRTVHGDAIELLPLLPEGCVDLVIADPPYNLTKSFNGERFSRRPDEEYLRWLETWLPHAARVLRPGGSLYACCDWQSSAMLYLAGSRLLTPRSRITWEREKGRGAKRNWKNCSEDIWFFTKGEDYVFNAEAVKLRRKVIAPYTDEQGRPKDWSSDGSGAYRMTCASNFWSDLTVPFWSMPENTDHPTQKPEKLVAKLVLASSNPGDLVLDPFLGSGTTSVVARKLARRFVGIERDETYACLAEKRLALAERDRSIQGYDEGVFWERNSGARRGAAALT